MSNSLLPPNASKIEHSVETLADAATSLKVPVRHLWSPQDCPLEVIAWLGWALSVDNWDPNWSDAQKRATVANAVEVHRRKGTVGAVKRALAVLGHEVEVDEKTGQVYTFNVRLKPPAGVAVTVEDQDEAERLALGAKNVRSHLANVGVVLEQDGSIRVRSASVSGEKTIVWPEILDLIEAIPSARILSAEQSFESITIAPFFENSFQSELHHAVAAVGAYSISLTAEGTTVCDYGSMGAGYPDRAWRTAFTGDYESASGETVTLDSGSAGTGLSGYVGFSVCEIDFLTIDFDYDKDTPSKDNGGTAGNYTVSINGSEVASGELDVLNPNNVALEVPLDFTVHNARQNSVTVSAWLPSGGSGHEYIKVTIKDVTAAP